MEQLARPPLPVRTLLLAKLALAGLEVVLGLALLTVGALRVDVGEAIRSAARHELRQDPGDVVARWAIRSAGRLGPRSEVVGGVALGGLGAFKALLLLAALRRHRAAVILGSAFFALAALAATAVLVRHPTPTRLILGGLDAAVAGVLIREALRIPSPATGGLRGQNPE